MGDGAEEFRRVALLLQRIGAVGLAEQFDLFRLHFPFLSRGGRGDEIADDFDGGSCQNARKQVGSRQSSIDDDLQTFEA